jgi:hypothetical protein
MVRPVDRGLELLWGRVKDTDAIVTGGFLISSKPVSETPAFALKFL